jgi:hypothetical protein
MAGVYPARGSDYATSFLTAGTGFAINASRFAGSYSLIVGIKPGQTGTVTVKVQSSPADPADSCISANTWADLNLTDPCSGGAITNMISVDTANTAQYNTTTGVTYLSHVVAVPGADFLRAVVSPATAVEAVIFTGHGRNVPV